MPQTPLTSATAYASPADLLAFHDARQVGDLVQDVGVKLDATALLADPNVAAALLAASGEVEAACLVAGRYAPADLAALTGAAQGYLKRIVCTLAFWILQTRRKAEQPLTEPAKQAMATLDLLRKGERIFGTVESVGAANISVVPTNAYDGGPPVTPYVPFRERFTRYFGGRY